MPLRLIRRDRTNLPVEGATLSPETLGCLAPSEAARVPVPVGNQSVALAELFDVVGEPEPGRLEIEGDLSRVHGLAGGMRSGELIVRGNVGDRALTGMSGGRVEIQGSAGSFAGAEMSGGFLRIARNAGDYLGAALPGSPVGMREGVILVGGSVGTDAGTALGRGLIAVGGDAGERLGAGLVAGSIFVKGKVAPFAGLGMKRGSIVAFDPEFPPLRTFEASGRFRPHTLNIFLKRLADWGFGRFDELSAPAFDRYNGDLAGRGRGEILVARSRAAERTDAVR